MAAYCTRREAWSERDDLRLCEYLYGCEIGDGTKIGTFVEIQKGAWVGRNCKISSHSFICEGVAIEDEVFVQEGIMLSLLMTAIHVLPHPTVTCKPRTTGTLSPPCSNGCLDRFRGGDPVWGDHW